MSNGSGFLETGDKILRIVTSLLLFSLILTQGLLLLPEMGVKMNYALRLEGKPLQNDEMLYLAGGVSTSPWATLSLKLVDYVSRPQVKVVVDGREITDFLQSEVTLTVKHGSIISVINPETNAPVTIRVSKITGNISQPAVQTQIRGNGILQLPPVVIN